MITTFLMDTLNDVLFLSTLSLTVPNTCCTCTVFENHRKSLIQHCERSELRLQKLIKNAKDCQFWRVFENLNQCYQKGQIG